MTSALGLLQRPPEAGTEPIAVLVDAALQGRIRVPEFQRPLKWGERNVLDLFDSIYRGLPVGSLLFWKRPAPADTVHLGPLKIPASQHRDAWWVVDGQQRLTSLTAALARPLPLPGRGANADPFIVYFDADEGEFRAPPARGAPPTIWVPLPVMLDATRLSEWVHEWQHGKDRALRHRVFEAGTRIRDYKLPRYLVEAPDDKTGRDLLQEIFFRVNNTGKRLEWNEVYDALYGQESEEPSTTRQLSDELARLGMGRPDEKLVTTCLLALRGLDVTRPLAEHRRRDPDVLRGAVAEALPALRQALTFLRARAEIPHLRLLPRTMILEVLARFFGVHPEPKSRTLVLLARWVWRVLLGEHTVDERTLERRAVTAVGPDEELSIQAMLALVPRRSPVRVGVPDSFDARTAESRLALLAMTGAGPRNMLDGSPIDVAALLSEHGVDAFPQLVHTRSSKIQAIGGPENRIIHPPVNDLSSLIRARLETRNRRDPVLASHGIGSIAASALRAGATPRFLSIRREALDASLHALSERLTGWSRGDHDRATIAEIVKRVPRDP